ncbi:competence type IV pilus minor pilin ComGD [Neobacillus sp. K501]
MINNQKGFTLIESLVVLSIFIIISSITVVSIKPQYYMADDETFISQLKADLNYAQQFAISHQKEVKVNFIPNRFRYIIYENNNSPNIIERQYSPNIHVSPGSIPLYFKYLPNGNVDQFGSLYFKSTEKSYRLTILIGKGRFYVAEE